MKKITKTFIILLILTISITLFTPVVKADDEEETSSSITMSVETENEKVEAGEEFKVDVKVNQNEEGVMALQGVLSVDTSVFEIVDRQVVKENWFLSAYNEDTNMFMIELTDDAFYDENSYIYETETIMEVTLKVKDDVSVKTSNVEVTDIKVVNSEFSTQAIDTISTEIQITGTGSSVGKVVLIICVVILVIVILAWLVLKGKKNNKTSKKK